MSRFLWECMMTCGPGALVTWCVVRWFCKASIVVKETWREACTIVTACSRGSHLSEGTSCGLRRVVLVAEHVCVCSGMCILAATLPPAAAEGR